MSERYQAFEILILRRMDGVYPLRAKGSGDTTYGGAMTAGVVDSLDADHWLEQALREPATMCELGGRLFGALFKQEILEGFRSELAAARALGLGLRLVLTVEPPELALLPWELLYDEGAEGFLARSAATPIVRHLSTRRSVRPPIQGNALRVLIALAEPKRLPPLGANYQEVHSIAQALSRGQIEVDVAPTLLLDRIGRGVRGVGAALRALFVGRGRVRVKLVEHATRSKLKNTLREAERAGQSYHIVHFIGHGASNESGGYLILEAKDGTPDPVPAEQVAELLDGTGVNMVFLNACASAREGEAGPDFYPFRGVAQACINLGIRAALAMQVDIVDRVAGEYAYEFYSSLADG
ncbi:MAG: CHAT domain-containing protein, partial [Chloroflexota bacterium]